MLLTALTLATLVLGSSSAPVVTVMEGRISGINEISTKGKEFFAYFGVPYAKPPVDKLRLKDPLKVENWRGVKDGSKMPEPCLHVPLNSLLAGRKVKAEDLEGKEDCLYLNVFTPKRRKPHEMLPVMVWIHGGAFVTGGANEYLPHVLMNNNIVLVVLQYRLGVLGFVSTEDRVIPGNLGLKDQTEALRWVQNNIHSFGGDSSRVTIFGESAGGASVHYHILSPLSKGLFSRAIMQSGTALSGWALRRKSKQAAFQISRILRCPKCLSSHDLNVCFHFTEAREDVAAIQDVPEWLFLPIPMVPRVDHDFVPDDPAALMLKGRHNEVEVMSGVVRDEGSTIAESLYANEALREALAQNFSYFAPFGLFLEEEEDASTLAEKIFEYYLGGRQVDETNSEQVVKMYSDWTFKVPHDVSTWLFARNPATPTFRYELKHRARHSMSDLSGLEVAKDWVAHADDLFYLFRGGPLLASDDLPDRPADLLDPEDLKVRDLITTMWTNFAATGNPTPDDSLGFKWEPATETHFRHLVLQPSPVMEDDDRKEVRKFLTSLPTKSNKILFPESSMETAEEVYQQEDSKQEL